MLFRVVDVDGQVVAGTARLEAEGDLWRVTSVDIAPGDISLAAMRDEGGLPLGWPLAMLIAVVLTLAAVAIVTLVRRSSERPS